MDAFNDALSTVTDHLSDESLMESGKVDAPLLLLGLIYREVSRCMEVEPGENTTAPSHLVDSPLGIDELNQIEDLINGLVVPS